MAIPFAPHKCGAGLAIFISELNKSLIIIHEDMIHQTKIN